jgi:hypothetical protein
MQTHEQLSFTEFCILEYLDYLENNQEDNLSFDEYVSNFRYMLIERWRDNTQITIH